MSKMSKISVSLPQSLVSDLDYVANRMGVSRSAVLSQFLTEAASDARRVLELIPPNPTPAELLRMRGQSEDLIRERLDQVQGMTNDLFSKP